ncbi:MULTISPECIES: alpha/beta fold hydrolase [Microbacterium]|uniref:alpha/beta fold hydrolase n=1 Tax=Microbacterium TaxID=33882 RepID=UPI00278AD172|nr:MULTISPECIES: alpha/beta fold hydrolase [Microbacterium]MDQ1082849.1 pimeloyl-ACP methyl ester carboxylesterase [Microbacterium sp. SORGH_AS_0344]MDQ1168382.1 pimeloyl-ACP methyl ester carboxylesterase [Microbacterium proteolyticum]
MPDDSRPVDVQVETFHRGPARTRVTRVGTGATTGRSFVLVAGIGVASTYFEFLAPLLAEEGDVYALDLPGFGGVPASGEHPTPRFFADQVEGVIDHYGLADPVLIGHSMGTQVVTEVLARRHDLSHAVLVSPVVDETEANALLQAVRFAQSTVRESVHIALLAVSAYLLCGFLYFFETLPHMLRYRISDRIGAGRATVLLIRGEFDRPSPRRLHSRLVARAASGRRWEIEGAAHCVVNSHAVGVARLTMSHVRDELSSKGRMPAADAAVPPAAHADVRMVLGAMASRLAEWVSAARKDEHGVERAKARHARVLWNAYRPSR